MYWGFAERSKDGVGLIEEGGANEAEASMFAGELVFGSEMTVIRALEEKCEIRSCSYLVDEALTSEECQ